MSYPITSELSQAKQLMSESKFKEAIEVINELEDKKDLTLQDQLEIHHLKSSLLLELGYLNEALKYAELAYKESQQLKNNLQIIDVLLTKSDILGRSSRKNESLKTIIEAEQILNTINQLSSIEFKEKKAYVALDKGGLYFDMGDLNRSLKHTDEGLTIAKEIKNKQLIMLATKRFGFIYSLKGEYNRAFKYQKGYLSLAKELDDKQEIIGALNSIGIAYTEKGDFNQALDHLERSLSLCDEINSWKTGTVLTSLFDLYINMNSLEKAQQCLDRMKQIINQEYNKWLDDAYRLGKAMVLKKKPQDINHLKAKEILKQIVDEEGTFIETNYIALIHLCDLYLTDLCETNDLKTLDEIHPYLTQLKDIAKTQQSFWLLVEAYSFQAKLKLITFEFKEAQKLLTKALDIAEKYGQERLAKRLLNEQDELSKNFIKWEKLKASGASMSERMDLARIDEQIEILLQKRRYLKQINGQS